MSKSILLLVLAQPLLAAAVPAHMAVQGRLTGLHGGPTPGPIDLQLSLTVDSAGLQVVHTEVASVVADADGVFGAVLGASAPLDGELVAEADELWLIVGVEGAPIGAPLPLSSVAFALHFYLADVARAIPVAGSEPLPCTGASLGALYFDTALATPRLCGLSGWISLVGPAGPAGPAGPEGPKGDPGEPRLTIDGLIGGTLTGDLTVTGSFTANGGSVGYPKNPRVLFGFTPDLCTPSHGDTYYGYQELPATFAQNPVVMATNDESLNNNGATWLRLRSVAPNRFGLRCNAGTDAISWMTIDPGSHVIDGKMVVAGRTASIGNNSSVFFNAIFPTNPVVLLLPDESGDDNGMSRVRMIGAGATSGFQVWADGNGDALQWVAMEPGTYRRGRFRWVAGTLTPTSCSDPCNFTFPTPFSSAPGMLLTIQDTDNNGPTWIRTSKTTPTGFSFRWDSTAGERVHYVAFETDE